MKNNKFCLILVILLSWSMQLQGLDISMKTARFKSQNQSYVEVCLYVIGSSVKHDTLPDNQLQAGVHMILYIEDLNHSILAFDKFTMMGPSGFVVKDFMDLKRLPLGEGAYTLVLEATDQNDPSNKQSLKIPIEPIVKNLNFQLSDIQLNNSVEKKEGTSTFIKNGYFFQPAAFHFFPAGSDQIYAYTELYHDGTEFQSEYYIRYAIYQEVNDNSLNLISQKFKKIENLAFQALILQLPLTELPSGNYQFHVELRDSDKQIILSKINDFQRSNPYKDFVGFKPDESIYNKAFVHSLQNEELEYILKALTPVVKGTQSLLLQQIMFAKDVSAQKYFIWSYFAELSPTDPLSAYKQFKEIAQAIDVTFRSHVGYGFETDRGRIYMKYGRPTEIIRSEEEPSSPPYEIWFYNQIEEVRQVNVKFIFHNPSLANNDMVLLHSNCKSERYNPRWEIELYKNAPGEQEGNSPGATNMKENYRRDARKIWDEL